MNAQRELSFFPTPSPEREALPYFARKTAPVSRVQSLFDHGVVLAR